MPKVLVTGAGQPAGIAVLRQIAATGTVELFAADTHELAAGLYLVPQDRRFLLPDGDDPAFVAAIAFLCAVTGIAVVVPTGDAEMLPLARARRALEDAGVRLLLPSLDTLETCLDTWTMVQRCASAGVPVPETVKVDEAFDSDAWETWPCIVRVGVEDDYRAATTFQGSHLVLDVDDLRGLPRDEGLVLQEYLPGEGYVLAVLARDDGHVSAVVPQIPLRGGTGLTVGGRTMHDDELEKLGRTAAQAVGLTGVATIEVRRDSGGQSRLITIDPRFSSTLPLAAAAGVDIPSLALAGILGEPPPDTVEFSDVAMVQRFEPVVMAADAFERVPRVGATGPIPIAEGAGPD